MVEGRDDARPLVIQDSSGRVIDLGLMNEKAHKKSLENGVLWIVDKVTGRVLPYGEKVLPVKVERAEFGYTAVLTGGSIEREKSSVVLPVLSETNDTRDPGNILDRLSRIIALRRQEMPEGSYTTHLFKSGPDKIRKKLGEEAIEVILARTDREILSESADLIYHLLVFLESKNLNINSVMDTLEDRE